VVWGLVILSVEMVVMSVLSGFSFDTFALSRFTAIKYGLALGFRLPADWPS